MPEAAPLARLIRRSAKTLRSRGRRRHRRAARAPRRIGRSLESARLDIPASGIPLLGECPVTAVFWGTRRRFLAVPGAAAALRVVVAVVFIDDNRPISTPPEQLAHDQVLRQERPETSMVGMSPVAVLV